MNEPHENPETHSHDQASWLERNVNLVIALLIAACIGTLVAQWLYSPMYDEHHPAHFELENLFGFQAIFGFTAFVIVVFLGRILRVFVKREEDYYDS